MILILSKENDEFSTEQVMDWLSYYGASFHRLNGASFYRNLQFKDNSFLFNDFNIKDVNVIWNRRWLDDSYILDKISPSELDYQNLIEIHHNLTNELKFPLKYFIRNLINKKWVTHPDELSIYKLVQLEKANEVGLKTPKTIITTSKKELLKFIQKYNRVISKPISNPASFFKYKENGNIETYRLLTLEVDRQLLSKIEDYFFPSLFQPLIEKDFEIRTFYLNRRFYSMAIFSQLDSQTSVDFRNYNQEKPNRTVPFILPTDIEKKLQKLIDDCNYSTGSIDLIYTKNKEYVFLEINPVGQFGMTSYPCNYNLEKKLAQYLIKLDEKSN